MTTFEKHYIGKGTQVENLDIVRIVIPVEGLDAAVFEKNGVKYLSFEVAKLKQEDKFGRTHTCYYQTKVSSTIQIRIQFFVRFPIAFVCKHHIQFIHQR